MAGEQSDETKTRKDILWGMYTDLRTHARHAEMLRSNVVNFMVVVTSVLVAVIVNGGHVTRKALPLCVLIVLVGLLGLAFAASYTELYERNRNRATRIRETLDREFFTNGTTIATLLHEADEHHEAGVLYRWSRRLTGSTQRFWFVLPSLITIAGLLLAVLAL
jgi:hypothetical protein